MSSVMMEMGSIYFPVTLNSKLRMPILSSCYFPLHATTICGNIFGDRTRLELIDEIPNCPPTLLLYALVLLGSPSIMVV